MSPLNQACEPIDFMKRLRLIWMLLLSGMVVSCLAQTRIMLIGNSITEGLGSSTGTGWRRILYDSLAQIGYDFEFVGPAGEDPIKGHFYRGKTIGSFYTGPGGNGEHDVALSMAQYEPHVLLLHLGTNDLYLPDEIGPYGENGNLDATTVSGRLATLIAYLLDWQNGTEGDFLRQLFVSAIIPRADSSWYERRSLGLFNTLYYNIDPDSRYGRIPSIPPYSFRLIDQFRPFDVFTMMSGDSLHPNDTGHQHMAQIYFDYLRFYPMFFRKVRGDGQKGRPGEILAVPLTVEVRKGYNVPAQDVDVSFEVISGNVTFTTPETTIKTNAAGEAQLSVQITGEGRAVIGATVYSMINKTLTFSVTSQGGIYLAGEVLYQSSQVPVPESFIDWIEGGIPIDTTDLAGVFSNTALPFNQDFSIRPGKTGDDQGAILSYDAALIAGHVVRISSLSREAQQLADVNGDGRINLIDAVQVARYAVGFSNPVGIQTGEWIFTPGMLQYSQPGDTVTCPPITAGLMGDVSTSWSGGGSSKTAATDVTVSTEWAENTLEVILKYPGENVLSSDLNIHVDTRGCLTYLSCDCSAGFQISERSGGPNLIRLGLFRPESDDDSVFVRIRYERSGMEEDNSPIQIQDFYVNETKLPDRDIQWQSADPEFLPDEPALYPNYPNPFNPETRIRFVLPHEADARLTILNTSGQTLRRLHSGRKTAGIHEIVWDGRLDSGQPAPSGIYFIQLLSDGKRITHKINLVR